MKRDCNALLELDQREIAIEELTTAQPRVKSERSARRRTSSPERQSGVLVGVLAGFAKAGLPLVRFPNNTSDDVVQAQSTVTLTSSQIGCKVVLLFEQGDSERPIILGCLQELPAQNNEPPMEVTIDGEKLTLSADREIVLRCGKASITLTRAGRVSICGTYLLSRSLGVNRVKGGSVQIN